MCLAVLGWQVHADYPLVLVANRDELHSRPTAPLEWWDAPGVLGGRDLEAGGTWLAVDANGRFGLVTNLRGAPSPAGAPSRGSLIPRFLAGSASPGDFLASLAAEAARYAGFNLVVGSRQELACLSNADDRGPRLLKPGIHGLSNGAPGSDWPKVRRGRERLASVLGAPDAESLLAVLEERHQADDADLPDTGVGLELERVLSPQFIVAPHYGTRSTTALLLAAGGGGAVIERSFAPDGTAVATRRVDLPPTR
jgi:uncharacterized protein with NRDE domain